MTTERFNYPRLTLLSLCFAILMTGCGTTTNRIATEQLLVSNAIDEAIAQINFSELAGAKVYLDETYLKDDRKAGIVNTNYVTSSLRQQLTAAGCQIFDSKKEADVIVEPRVGAMGTDGHNVTYGIPKTGGLLAAASTFSGSPIGSFPEISFAQTDAQSGIAKLVVFAYDGDTRRPIWQSGTAKAESNCTSTWVLGAGPFQKGTVYDSTRFAGREINRVGGGNIIRSGWTRKADEYANKTDQLRYDSAYVFPRATPSIEANAEVKTIAEKDSDTFKDDHVQKAKFEEPEIGLQPLVQDQP